MLVSLVYTFFCFLILALFVLASVIAFENIKMFRGSVSNVKMFRGSVLNLKMFRGSVSNVKMFRGSVSNVKMFRGSVLNLKMFRGSVSNVKMFRGLVSNVKIFRGSVIPKLPCKQCRNHQFDIRGPKSLVCKDAPPCLGSTCHEIFLNSHHLKHPS